MFIRFFHELKKAGVPVTVREYLTLMEALDADVIERAPTDFYYLSRATLVKDERNIDKFDKVFGATFKGWRAWPRASRSTSPRTGCASSPRNSSPRRRRPRSRRSAAGTS